MNGIKKHKKDSDTKKFSSVLGQGIFPCAKLCELITRFIILYVVYIRNYHKHPWKRRLAWKAYLETLKEQPECELNKSKKEKIFGKINDHSLQKIQVEVKTENTVNEFYDEKPTSSKFSRIIGTLGRSISRSSIREDFQIDPFHDQPEVSMVSRVIGNISRSISRSSIFSNGSDSEGLGVHIPPQVFQVSFYL